MVVKFTLDLRITGSAYTGAVIELDSPDELIAAPFKAITHSRNLRHLSGAFDPFFIVVISRLGFELLPGLDYLTIRRGAMYCPRTPPPLRIRVKIFSYYNPFFHSTRQNDRIWSFLPALEPQGWLNETSDLLHIFRNLHSVSITCTGFPLMQDQGATALFPALRNLTITGTLIDWENTLQFGTSLCPLLEHFTVWELFPGVMDLQLNIMFYGNSPEAQVHTQGVRSKRYKFWDPLIFTEVLRAPTALEQVTIRWKPEDEIMGMLHGLESRLRRAVPGLHSLHLDGGSRLPSGYSGS
ncbi:hypothetical protein B0H13DRAFT_1851543 [Mycena leptocephala]|nr:hypothetical protein B0H13DRAFT_1851543 [Mycena leptocephala]